MRRDRAIAGKLVYRAIHEGKLPRLDGSIPCVDCGKPARVYDHRDYKKPLEVAPVCRGCNKKRGKAITSTRRRPHPIHSRFIRWRKALGLSQRQLARLAGVPLSTLNEIENGYRSGHSIREHLMGALRKVAGRVAPVAVEILKVEKSA